MGLLDKFNKLADKIAAPSHQSSQNVRVDLERIKAEWPNLADGAGVFWTSTGEIGLDVVGESFHNDALFQIADEWDDGEDSDDEWLRFTAPAFIGHQRDNEYDPNAVVVIVGDEVVGHLPREAAAVAAPKIDRFMADKRMVIGGIAHIRGRVEGNLGVKLDIHIP